MFDVEIPIAALKSGSDAVVTTSPEQMHRVLAPGISEQHQEREKELCVAITFIWVVVVLIASTAIALAWVLTPYRW